MHLKGIFFWGFLFCFVQLHAQEKHSKFSAYGVIPSEVPPSLYYQLKHAKNTQEKLTGLDTIAKVFNQIDLPDSLLTYAKKMQREVLNIQPQEKTYQFYKFRAFYYDGLAKQKMGLLDEAIASYIKGIEITPSKNHEMLAYFKLGLAEIYLQRNQLQKAEAILNKLNENRPYTSSVKILIKATQADFYLFDNNVKEAEELYHEILNDSAIHTLPKINYRVRLNIGRLEAMNNNIDKAIHIFQQTKKEALALGFYDLYIKSVLNEGEIYLQQENYDIAEVAFSTAYVNTVSWNRLELQKKINRAMVKLYVAKENYKNAFNLMTQYLQVSNQIAAQQNERVVRELEEKYETLQKEQEIVDLQAEQFKNQVEIDHQKTVKNAILIGFIILLIPILLLLVVYYQKLQAQSKLNEQQKLLNIQEMQSLQQAQELKLTKTAMQAQSDERSRIARELHDSIGGNLAAIKLQLNTVDLHNDFADKLMQQLDKTYSQVREISHSLIPEEFKEQSFVTLITEYLLQFHEQTQTQFYFNAHPEEEINQLEESIQVNLFNIIKELVTNALKHAQAEQVDIQFNYIEEENSISLMYEDDGVGFNPKEKANGIGLKNLNKRIKDLNASLDIDSAVNKGTVISISFQKIN
ncbi:tetratricopeptide repeat-containing sensor histidine kinase [Mesonia aestuariivivens]|uniref:histidine kinase n=1 Tax=Mesonia aestuariivivens TaxID=2796128 RepID=A0ABS6W0I7_9FLAO|nr:sensor histidine kinase [Mesonia aestuariivivens]MBW2961031.1 sensor histidine kinase [Mesonia aestuariivivens]